MPWPGFLAGTTTASSAKSGPFGTPRSVARRSYKATASPQLPRPVRNLPGGRRSGSRPTKARRTPSRSSRLELAAAASPASTGGRAPGRALGAPRFQEAYFVAVASDSCWQFGLACPTSWRDRHAVRLSNVVGRGGRQRWSRAVQADSSTVSDPRPGLIAPRSKATRQQSSDTEISARILEQDPDFPSRWRENPRLAHRRQIVATAFRTSSTAPRIEAITSTTAAAMHTARMSFSIAVRRNPGVNILRSPPPSGPHSSRIRLRSGPDQPVAAAFAGSLLTGWHPSRAS